MAPCDFTLKVAGDVSIVAVQGQLDAETALHLLQTATIAARVCRLVRIDLHGVESMTHEAAALLLFKRVPGEALPENIVLQANGEPGRQTILEAFARHRAGDPAIDRRK